MIEKLPFPPFWALGDAVPPGFASAKSETSCAGPRVTWQTNELRPALLDSSISYSDSGH